MPRQLAIFLSWYRHWRPSLGRFKAAVKAWRMIKTNTMHGAGDEKKE
jgi:hypothetical protein